MDDLISRQAAIDGLDKLRPRMIDTYEKDGDCFLKVRACDVNDMLQSLPSAQSDNQVNLCDSCKCSYPDCPSEVDDVIFGNGKGNDNICACNKYEPSAQPDIIRCRNCKFASGDSRICMKFGHSPIGELDFCAWAERRTDE